VTVVGNTLVGVSGAPVRHQRVVVETSVRAWTADGQIVRPWEGVTGADGAWSVDLPATADLTPAGVVYRVSQPGDGWRWFTVPAGAGPFALLDVLVEAPQDTDAPEVAQLKDRVTALEEAGDPGTIDDTFARITYVDDEIATRETPAGAQAKADAAEADAIAAAAADATAKANAAEADAIAAAASDATGKADTAEADAVATAAADATGKADAAEAAAIAAAAADATAKADTAEADAKSYADDEIIVATAAKADTTYVDDRETAIRADGYRTVLGPPWTAQTGPPVLFQGAAQDPPGAGVLRTFSPAAGTPADLFVGLPLPEVLVVTNTVPFDANHLALETLLRSDGFWVIAQDVATLPAAGSPELEALVAGRTVLYSNAAGAIGAHLKDITTGLVACRREDWNVGLGLTESRAQATGQSSVTTLSTALGLTVGTHALRSGTSTIGHSNPSTGNGLGAAADAFAHIVGQVNQICAFFYDSGETLYDATVAAGRRVGLGLAESWYANANSAGKTLICNAVRKAAGLPNTTNTF